MSLGRTVAVLAAIFGVGVAFFLIAAAFTGQRGVLDNLSAERENAVAQVARLDPELERPVAAHLLFTRREGRRTRQP